jgi:ADP-heptose:LPS heptosyltransferase
LGPKSEVQSSASTGVSRNLGVDASRYAILHAGSGSTRKNWPAERWAEVIAMLPVERDLRLVLTLGPAEEAAAPALLDALGRLAPERQVVIARDLDLFELAALLQGASLFLGNDSGVAHLAAGLGRPTVAVFGPTDPQVWRPRGPSVRTLGGNEQAGIDGAALIADEAHWPSVEEVAQVARSLLDAGSPDGSAAHGRPGPA